MTREYDRLVSDNDILNCIRDQGKYARFKDIVVALGLGAPCVKERLDILILKGEVVRRHKIIWLKENTVI